MMPPSNSRWEEAMAASFYTFANCPDAHADYWWVFRVRPDCGIDHLKDEAWHGYGTRAEALDYLCQEFDTHRYFCEVETFSGMSDEQIDDIKQCGATFADGLPEDNIDPNEEHRIAYRFSAL
jgi:hypothetical protein